MYKVIMSFTDLQDDNHVYNIGDRFPRQGVEVSPDRITELLSSDNKRGIPLIEKEPPKSKTGKNRKGKSNARKDS